MQVLIFEGIESQFVIKKEYFAYFVKAKKNSGWCVTVYDIFRKDIIIPVKKDWDIPKSEVFYDK